MRIILIDAHSGFIWGDSADLSGRIFNGDRVLEVMPDADLSQEEDWALAFAQALDESLGETGRTYEAEFWRAGQEGRSGYYAYRADVGGSEAVPVVQNGQDQAAIEAVERDCEQICFVAYV